MIKCVYMSKDIGLYYPHTLHFEGNSNFEDLRLGATKLLSGEFYHLRLASKLVDGEMHAYNSIEHKRTLNTIIFNQNIKND